jgi:hypothetical protein
MHDHLVRVDVLTLRTRDQRLYLVRAERESIESTRSASTLKYALINHEIVTTSLSLATITQVEEDEDEREERAQT